MPGMFSRFALARFEGRTHDPFDRRLFKKDTSVPPPDPQIGAALNRQAALGEEGLAFLKQQYEESKPRQAKMDALSEELTRLDMDSRRTNEGRAAEQWTRYKDTFAPAEDIYVQEAMEAGSEADQATAAGKAAATVQASTDSALKSQERAMQSMGVNPNSGKFAATSRAGSLSAAAAKAGAMNSARDASKSRRTALLGSVSNMGRGLAADTNAGYGLGLQAGGAAGNSANFGNALLASRNNQTMSGYGLAMQGNQAHASGLGQLRAQDMNLQAANNASQAAITGALIGGGMAMASDRRAKEDIHLVGQHANGLNLYEFKYRDEFAEDMPGRYIGVMADEVEKVRPDCVVLGSDGFKRVDYAKLGMRMEAVS